MLARERPQDEEIRLYEYDGDFYGFLSSFALESARRVVPRLTTLLPLRSVVDFGCGQGALQHREHGRSQQDVSVMAELRDQYAAHETDVDGVRRRVLHVRKIPKRLSGYKRARCCQSGLTCR